MVAAETELRQLFGLTATEARLANLLMEGKTFEECCQQLGVRCSTARMHVRNLFEKTGVRRQSQLISLLLKSIGLVRTESDDGAREAKSTTAPHISDRKLSRSAARVRDSLARNPDTTWLDLLNLEVDASSPRS